MGTLKYSIMELKAKDIFSINKMYDSRSNGDAVFFQCIKSMDLRKKKLRKKSGVGDFMMLWRWS